MLVPRWRRSGMRRHRPTLLALRRRGGAMLAVWRRIRCSHPAWPDRRWRSDRSSPRDSCRAHSRRSPGSTPAIGAARRGRDDRARVRSGALRASVRRPGRRLRVPRAGCPSRDRDPRGMGVPDRATVSGRRRRIHRRGLSGKQPACRRAAHRHRVGFWPLAALVAALTINYLGVRIGIRAIVATAAVSSVPFLGVAVAIIAAGGVDGNTLAVSTPRRHRGMPLSTAYSSRSPCSSASRR